MRWQPDWGLRVRMFVTMFLLFVLFIVFAGAITWYLGGGALMMGLLFCGFSLAQWYFSDRITLWSMGGSAVSEDEAPELHAMIERLSQQADLPKPTVAIADNRVPNAFATGRSQSHAVVCVTSGILGVLEDDELEGVLAHELSHIKNHDMVVMTVASMLGTLAFIVVRWGWLFGGGRSRGNNGGGSVLIAIAVSFVVWIVSFLLIRALSRYREYAADRGSAAITGKPAALASALLKISGRIDKVPEQDLRDHAQMNAFFIIPLRAGVLGQLFATHPSTEKRVERLRALERELETV